MRSIGRRQRQSKSLRAFAFEVSIVVIGVLIALGAQQAADAWNWRGKVADGERLLGEEAFLNLGASVELYAAAPCLAAQVEAARTNLAGPGRKPLSAYRDEFGRFVVRTPLRPLYRASWDALLADGTLAHLSKERFAIFSGSYETATKLAEVEVLADAQAQGLLALTHPGALDPDTVGRVAEAADRLDQTIAFARIVAQRNIVAYQRLGLKADEKRIERYLQTSPALVACRAKHLPVADWHRAASERLSPLTV